MNETFTNEMKDLRARIDVAEDIFGSYGLKHLEEHYDWNINYHETREQTEEAEEWKRKKELLAEACFGIESALRGFFDTDASLRRFYNGDCV